MTNNPPDHLRAENDRPCAIVALGTTVPHYGTIIAIGHVGERYYWMDRDGAISMMPASLIERAALRSGGE